MRKSRRLIATAALAAAAFAVPSLSASASTSVAAPSTWKWKGDFSTHSDCVRHGLWEIDHQGGIDYYCAVEHAGSAVFWQLFVEYP
jgi:Spy/CpxP family protein refolding chaperone